MSGIDKVVAAGNDWIAAQQQASVNRLMDLASINSGTGNLAGLKTMCSEYQRLFEPLCDDFEVIDSASANRVNHLGESVTEKYGQLISCCKRPDAPVQILLVGHMDTVFPADHSFQTPRIVDSNTIHGPGVADMKGGILVMLNALKAFEQTRSDNQLGWRVILNADEETGSHGSVAVLEEAARLAHAGLIYEPALADGTLAGARKGSGNFTLLVRGLAAHAGREISKGRNAILLMTEAAQAIAKLSQMDKGITVNIARVTGGTVFNVVPDQAVCQFNIRCESTADQQATERRLNEIVSQLSQREGYSVELSGAFSRPPKMITPANQLLMDWLVDCGNELEVKVNFKDTGGCCDGNNLAAAGLPNIDTLGVLGGHIHTDKEFMLSHSLTQRAQLSFLLLRKLASKGELLGAASKGDGIC